ncbi:Uncharacterised protein [Mycobacteroides abscessus subsp. abscessus]|nr:Uncharacterised protein [Mycobacteroides abscessus subsp. abscessus]
MFGGGQLLNRELDELAASDPLVLGLEEVHAGE